ncbi:MAG: hypothetical protein K0R26_772 [Bacteroidota bacterium]|jgi:hypothetical protein|nr:hypothetical protein [Bacteroidota bacterium]
MKEIIGTVVFCFLLLGCSQVNTNGEKTITQGGDTVADVNISLSKLDAISELADINEPSELLFKASGTEPGWFAEFYNDKLRLVVDYGKDSVWINDSFEKVIDAGGFTYLKTLKDKDVTISVENKPCVNAAGDKTDRSVILKFNSAIYKGCGSFIK